MSANLRPTVTTWGPHTSRFLDVETTDEFMLWLADQAAVELEFERRRDGKAYTFLDGKPVLTFLARCQPARIATRAAWGADAPDLLPLLQNMKRLAPQWERWLDPVEGTLTLFSD